MKYITFAVPCYNSQDYMRRCVDSLLAGGRDVEIILINDGSSDDTGRIADEYQLRHPDIVRAVHKPNGGHGSGVNKGLELARGLYYKVVDSDDWLDAGAYRMLLGRIRDASGNCAAADARNSGKASRIFSCATTCTTIWMRGGSGVWITAIYFRRMRCADGMTSGGSGRPSI